MGKLRVTWGQMKGKHPQLSDGAKYNFGFGPLLDKFEAVNKQLKSHIKELDALLDGSHGYFPKDQAKNAEFKKKEKENLAKQEESIKKINAARTKIASAVALQTQTGNQLLVVAQKYHKKSVDLRDDAGKDLMEIIRVVQEARNAAQSSESIIPGPSPTMEQRYRWYEQSQARRKSIDAVGKKLEQYC